MSRSHGLLTHTRNALRRLRKSPMPALVAVVFPLISWLILAMIFHDSIIRDIPVIVVDRDGSALSRLFARSLDATQSLHVIGVTESNSTAREAIEQGAATVAVLLPEGMEKCVKQRRSATVISLSNGANLLWSKIAYRAVMLTGYSLSTGIQMRRFEAQGLSEYAARGRALPVTTTISALGNPWYDYALYLIPGMVLALLQMSASGSTLWLFRRRREDRRGLHFPPAGQRVSTLVGNLLPLLGLNLIAVLLMFSVIFPLAGLPPFSRQMEMIGLTLLFTFASMGLGAFLSTLLPNIVTAAQINIVLNAPAFVFAGYTYPRWAMPDVVQGFANMLPLTHLLDGYFPLFLYSTPTTAGILPLCIFAFVTWGGTVLLISPVGDWLRDTIRGMGWAHKRFTTSTVSESIEP